MAARAARVTVWSEIELAWRFLRGRLVGVTGSNGKTTTTSLIAHILSCPGVAPGKQVILAGNIGSPLIAHVQESSEKTVTVAELSSFQLELIDSFRPDVSVLLNLTPDHLDRHASFEEYVRAKARIFENQMEVDDVSPAALISRAALSFSGRKERISSCSSGPIFACVVSTMWKTCWPQRRLRSWWAPRPRRSPPGCAASLELNTGWNLLPRLAA
jgi:UDP-N-acetylmuramoylalanine-D-glutamate ligase